MNMSKIWIWKLVIARAVMYSLLTLLTAFTTGVANCDFPTLTKWNQFLIIIGVVSSWLLTMMAFLDKSIATAKEEAGNQEPPPAAEQPQRQPDPARIAAAGGAVGGQP